MVQNTSSKTSFIKGFKSEFKKIVWPTKNVIINKTIVVIIFSIIITALIFGFDFIYTIIRDVFIKGRFNG